jgi:hypothetical protein
MIVTTCRWYPLLLLHDAEAGSPDFAHPLPSPGRSPRHVAAGSGRSPCSWCCSDAGPG